MILDEFAYYKFGLSFLEKDKNKMEKFYNDPKFFNLSAYLDSDNLPGHLSWHCSMDRIKLAKF